MSQNPNGGPPNYNPYGPTPSNPNYPAPPGTAYGGSQPPSGPNPGYNPYPPSNPPAGPEPNTPNSSYGPYGNPYAPPPPPSTGPNPYTNPPTPMPPNTGPNPYDAYAPTVMSQNQPSSPGYSQPSSPSYPMYNSQPAGMDMTPPPGAPGMQPQKRGRGGIIIAAVIALVVIVGGSIFGVVAYNNNQATLHANATATAIANVNAHATATAQVYASATAVASTYPFSNNLVLSDPLVDNSKGVNWDNNQGNGCFFSGSAYHVTDSQTNTYNTCAASKTDYSDFTVQVEMVIKQGGANAGGGLIFRADNANSKYYRLYIDQQGNYGLLVSVDTTGTNGNARSLKEGTASQFSTGLGQTNTISIVARGDQISFYINQQLVTTIADSTYSHGQIGVTADTLSGKTEVVYNNLKVWKL